MCGSCCARVECAEGQRDRLREALQKIANLDEAGGYELREKHAFEAVSIAVDALAEPQP